MHSSKSTGSAQCTWVSVDWRKGVWAACVDRGVDFDSDRMHSFKASKDLLMSAPTVVARYIPMLSGQAES